MLLTLIKMFTLVALISFSSLIYAGNISKNEAAASAQQAYSGRVLSVKLKKSVYKVKILSSSGQVRVVRVNAKNGKIR